MQAVLYFTGRDLVLAIWDVIIYGQICQADIVHGALPYFFDYVKWITQIEYLSANLNYSLGRVQYSFLGIIGLKNTCRNTYHYVKLRINGYIWAKEMQDNEQ